MVVEEEISQETVSVHLVDATTGAELVQIDQLDSPLLVPVPPQIALLLQQLQVLVNSAVRRVAEPVTDLAVRGRDASFLERLADEFEDLLLSFCQKACHTASLWRKQSVSQGPA